MKRCIWLLFLLIAVSLSSSAQLPSELGLFIGGTNFTGDVGDEGIHMPRKAVVGLIFRKPLNPHYNLRANLLYGKVHNADRLSDWSFRQNRNLAFESVIIEASAMVEFHFFPMPESDRLRQTPYVFAGLGAFYFNPKARIGDDSYELRELGTEGQGSSLNSADKYSRVAFAIPFGVGYKWSFNRITTLSLEAGFRRTYTDYLDDVSGLYVDPVQLAIENGQDAALLADRSLNGVDHTGTTRGNPNTDDWYVFTGVTLTVKLSPRLEKCFDW